MSTFWKRTIFGSLYIILLLGCVLWNKYSFGALMVFFISVMMHEFLKMTMGDEYKSSQVFCIIAGDLFFGVIWAARAFPAIKADFIFLAVIPVIVLMILSLYTKDKSSFGKFANIYTVLLYVALPMSLNNFLVLNKYGEYNGILLIIFFVIIWMSDIGGYVFGLTLGKVFTKKLFPEISPKKSWAGFIGGIVLALGASALMQYFGLFTLAGLKDLPVYHALILAFLMNIAGVYGDLFESQWKRYCGIKDSGKILPGHGGLLDRLDSSIFAIPAGTIYLILCNII